MSGKPEEKRRVTIGLSLPADVMAEARRRAAAEDRPFSTIVKRALVAYLGLERQPAAGAAGDGQE